MFCQLRDLIPQWLAALRVLLLPCSALALSLPSSLQLEAGRDGVVGQTDPVQHPLGVGRGLLAGRRFRPSTCGWRTELDGWTEFPSVHLWVATGIPSRPVPSVGWDGTDPSFKLSLGLGVRQWCVWLQWRLSVPSRPLDGTGRTTVFKLSLRLSSVQVVRLLAVAVPVPSVGGDGTDHSFKLSH
jgi:hypothetical protein